MKVLRAVLTGLLLALPALAAAQDVKIDFDKAFDFSTVKTYSIKLGTTWGNDLSQRRVMTEIDEDIAAKGWKKVDEARRPTSTSCSTARPRPSARRARSTAAVWAATATDMAAWAWARPRPL